MSPSWHPALRLRPSLIASAHWTPGWSWWTATSTSPVPGGESGTDGEGMLCDLSACHRGDHSLTVPWPGRPRGDGLGGLGGSCVQGSGGWIVIEGDQALAQVPDHILGTGLIPDVDAAAAAPPPLSSGRLGEQQVQGGQVQQDPVLTDVGVPSPGPGRPCWRWCGRGGTGRRACRWTRAVPPPASHRISAARLAGDRRLGGAVRPASGAGPRAALMSWAAMKSASLTSARVRRLAGDGPARRAGSTAAPAYVPGQYHQDQPGRGRSAAGSIPDGPYTAGSARSW